MAQMAACCLWEAQINSRSRTVFFLLQRIGAGEPVFRPLPVDAQTQERLAHRLDGNGAGHPAEANTLLDEQVECPQAGFAAEIAWWAMQHRFEHLSGHVFAQHGRQMGGTARSSLERFSSLPVECVDGMANGLFVA